MADLTVEVVNAKLAKGEALTKEESKFVMSLPPENADAGNKAPAEDDGIIWPEKDEEESTSGGHEETPEEKKAKEDKVAEDKKKEEASAAAKKVTAEDPKLDIERLESELAKPDGQENFEGLTKREVAYFWSMRRDRRARQKAEEERDAARFREIQNKKKEEEAVKAKEVVEEDPLEDLKKKDQEDFMTVADAVKVIEKALKKQPVKKTEEEVKPVKANPVHMKYLEFCDNEARSKHAEDYDAVMELASEVINTSERYVNEVGQAIANGENPAEKSYQLIKQDPEFSKLFPVAEAKWKAKKAAQKKPDVTKTPEELEKEKKARENEAALENNKTKIKTTGHAGGEGSGEGESNKVDGYSIEDIARMSDMQFARLPKKTREKFLQQYG